MSDLVERLRREGYSIGLWDAVLPELERLKTDNLALSERCKAQYRQIAKLTGALEATPPIKLDAGSWWYPEGDTSSEACCQSAWEVAKWSSQDIPLSECWGIGAFKNEDGEVQFGRADRASHPQGEHLR